MLRKSLPKVIDLDIFLKSENNSEVLECFLNGKKLKTSILAAKNREILEWNNGLAKQLKNMAKMDNDSTIERLVKVRMSHSKASGINILYKIDWDFFWWDLWRRWFFWRFFLLIRRGGNISSVGTIIPRELSNFVHYHIKQPNNRTV